MIKTYKLTTPVRNSSIVLRGKTNNSLRYNFAGGDPLTNKPATIILRSQYAQQLLEESELFAQGYVRIIRTDEGGEVIAESKKELIVKEDITTSAQLLEFVGTELERPYQKPKAALDYAEKVGYSFPNLKLE